MQAKRSSPSLSVVIATEGRAAKLEKTLSALAASTLAVEDFEVVVVLDGENAESRKMATRPRPLAVRLIELAKSGAGTARNAGVSAAVGRVVLFINDDTRPAPECLRTHLEAQRQLGPSILMGHVEWDPSRPVTPFMRWLAPSGHQFHFSSLSAKRALEWHECWAAQLSLPRSWADDTPFDSSPELQVGEDSEWAYRHASLGRPIRYLPQAVVFHDHYYAGPEAYRPRARAAGRAARKIAELHPEINWIALTRPRLAALARSVSMLSPTSWHRSKFWDLDYRWNFLLGTLLPALSRKT